MERSRIQADIDEQEEYKKRMLEEERQRFEERLKLEAAAEELERKR